MIFFSMFGKFGSFFASVPMPIMATLYCVLFGYVSSAGLGYLQFCNLNNFRNKSVLCISFFLGLSIPQYFTEYYHLKQHYEVLRWFNDVVTVIFMSHTTVAALVAFILDAHCPVKMMRHVKPSVWSGGRGSACTAHMLRMMNSILYHANLISFFHPFN
ncbi:hypothetical protein GLYMA_17G234102v4 [Glycine max]|nr:hypothetical protein GLYMA_17G234102v4 [Glycine max]